MSWKKESKTFIIIASVFSVCYYMPVGNARFDNAILEGFHLLKEYAREHVILCLIPAFFIAGAVSVFINQAAVVKYFGSKANKFLSYGVASVSGAILAVCSCTILPLFTSIYKMGAGLGPAVTFLYSGPAINIMAIILTARVLGIELGIARAVGAVVFSILIGLFMALIFRNHDDIDSTGDKKLNFENEQNHPVWQNVLFISLLCAILLFVNWGSCCVNPFFEDFSLSRSAAMIVTGKVPIGYNLTFLGKVYSIKWGIVIILSAIFALVLNILYRLSALKLTVLSLGVVACALVFPETPEITFSLALLGLVMTIKSEESEEMDFWLSETWAYTKLIIPLLFYGVLVSGILLGRPGAEGLIPSKWVENAVGGNSLFANFFASIAGAFMYFATLTEIPILQGLLAKGMGKGPVLALLLAGPALSLPNMLVIRTVMGTKKTVVYVLLVIVMSTMSGIIYGTLF